MYTHKPGHQITAERACTLHSHLTREDGPAIDPEGTAARASAAARPSLASLDEATAQKLRETSVADLLETETARLVQYDRLNDLFASGKKGQFSRSEGWGAGAGAASGGAWSLYSDGEEDDDDDYGNSVNAAAAAAADAGDDYDYAAAETYTTASENTDGISDSIEAAEDVGSEDDGIETDISSRTPSPASSRGSSRRSGGSRSTSVTADDGTTARMNETPSPSSSSSSSSIPNSSTLKLTAEQRRRARAKPVMTLGRTVHEVYGPQITLPRSLLPQKDKASVQNLFEVASELIAAKEDRLSVSASVTTSQGPGSYPVRGKPRLRTKQRPHSPPPAAQVKTYLHTPSKVAPIGADAGSGFASEGNAVTSKAVGQGPYPPWVSDQWQ